MQQCFRSSMRKPGLVHKKKTSHALNNKTTIICLHSQQNQRTWAIAVLFTVLFQQYFVPEMKKGPLEVVGFKFKAHL